MSPAPCPTPVAPFARVCASSRTSRGCYNPVKTMTSPMSSSGISISWRSLGTSSASVLRFLCVSGGFSSRKRFMRCAVAPRMSHRGSDKVVRRKAVRVTTCTWDICRHSDASSAWMLVDSVQCCYEHNALSQTRPSPSFPTNTQSSILDHKNSGPKISSKQRFNTHPVLRQGHACARGGRKQVNKALHTCTSWYAYARGGGVPLVPTLCTHGNASNLPREKGREGGREGRERGGARGRRGGGGGAAIVCFLCSGARRVQQPVRGSKARSAHGHWVHNHVQPPSWNLQFHTGEVCPQE